ncbi:Immunoglobulin-like domain [Trinorchestia longiramus]|nr:Immunoglobulin-like domain [Trinorchestia longiramus]
MEEVAHGCSGASVLQLQVSAADHQRVFTCEASNGVTDATKSNTSVSVRHSPVWIIAVQGARPAKEGDSLSLTALASAYPGPLRYTWERGGHILKSKEYSAEEIRHTRYSNGRPALASQSEDGVAYLLPHSNYAGAMSSSAVNDDGIFLQPAPEPFLYGSNSAQHGLLPHYGHGRYHFPDELLQEQKTALTDQPVGLLLLKDITRKESGKYSVIATSPRGSVNSTFHIDVMYPPEKVMAPPRLAADPGEDIELGCSAAGNPDPVISWYKLRTPVLDTFSPTLELASATDSIRLDNSKDGKLQLLSVNAMDTGAYQCLAENSVGRVAAHPSKLIVARNNFSVPALTQLLQDVPAAMQLLKQGVPAAIQLIKQGVPAAIQLIKQGVPTAVQLIKQGVPTAVQLMKQGVPAAIQLIKQGVPTAVQLIKQGVPAAIQLIK